MLFSSIFTISKANVENVVSPPVKPTINRKFKFVFLSFNTAKKNPIKNEPSILTKNVPL